MKNIHLIPTDKPSRLHLQNGNLVLHRLQYTLVAQHIYITSDEEIKDVRPQNGKWQLEKGQILNKFPDYLTDLSECKLVILTTDQDLIKDGVQAIDDEFLEFFVKNPSCEFVEVENSYVAIKVGKPSPKVYKIIIPKEETLEQVAERILKKNEVEDGDMILSCTFPNTIKSMVEMAEWQKEQFTIEEQYVGHTIDELDKAYIKGFNEGSAYYIERMYSEEEVMEMFHKLSMHLPLHYEMLVREMFKKK